MTEQYRGPFPNYEFSETRRLNPKWSSLVCFHEAIRGRKSLHPRLIRKYFGKLVEQDDYAPENKKEVLDYALKLARGDE